MQTKDYSTLCTAEAQLVAAARAGNTCPLIEYLYTEQLPGRAARLVNGYRMTYGARLEVEDVVQVGIEWVVREVNRALVVTNPVTWLLRVAQLHMLRYCSEGYSAIRVPASSQRKYGYRAPHVE